MALKWINLSAARGGMAGNTTATAELRNIVASEKTPEQIAEALRLVREWMAAFEKRTKN